MGIKKHDELDDQSGLPKFVKEYTNKATRDTARAQKVSRQQKSKTTDKHGNGGKR